MARAVSSAFASGWGVGSVDAHFGYFSGGWRLKSQCHGKAELTAAPNIVLRISWSGEMIFVAVTYQWIRMGP
jgi:hypothetical protein